MTEPVKSLPVEMWDISRLVPYAKNAKKHPAASVTKLARSMKKFGIRPIEVEPDGTIIAGHGRRLAAIENGWTKVPVVVRSDLTKLEADALRLADNQVVSTDYDTELLRDELIRLDSEGFDMTLTAFDEDELNKLMPDLGEIDDDLFTDDITGAVEEQKAENKEKEREVDASSAPVGDALGFKRVTVTQSRVIRGFMAKIEAKHGKQGVDALIAHIEGAGA